MNIVYLIGWPLRFILGLIKNGLLIPNIMIVYDNGATAKIYARAIEWTFDQGTRKFDEITWNCAGPAPKILNIDHVIAIYKIY